MDLKRFFFLSSMLVLFSLFSISFVNANETKLDIHVFIGQDCPHCAQLEDYLDNLKENDEYDFINPIYYEVWYNQENQDLFKQMLNDYGISSQGVPTYFIEDESFVGYAPQMNDEILETINSYKSDLDGNSNDENSLSSPINLSQYENDIAKNNQTINLPILGKISSNSISLPVLTILLGFLDGFNPCAFFILLFLLSMLVYAKSRKRMLIIGLTFVFFSGLIYFLFMSAWLNFFMITKNISYITMIAGLVALIIAAINIKDFFAFKKGVSLSVSEKHKKSLISRMRSLLKADSMVSMMFGTIVLAIAANLYELLCTAGFPMVFTKILVLNELNTLSYYSYLLFYNIVYVIPLLTIVLIFTYTFGAKKLSQEQGEGLKLLSGMMMLFLGMILVFKPGLLNNVFAAVGTIFSAIVLTGIILLIKKSIKKSKENQK